MTHSFFPTFKAGVLAGIVVSALMISSSAGAQVTGSSQTTTDAAGQQHESVTMSDSPSHSPKSRKKDEKIVQSKDTKKELRKEKKINPLVGQDAKLPDKELYDKAELAVKKGRYDVARLDLQTLLNTYPDSQYQMRAKLAIADSWYKEGGTAALTQAESEYSDFRVFFPNVPEAAEAQMRIGDIYFRQMDKPDRDYAKAVHAEEEYRRMLTDYPDSTLVPQATQRLRDVQEVLATREAQIGDFYESHSNWPAAIARLQTVVDTYPQYSHMDDVLVGLGDAYEAEARFVRAMKLPEASKARLERTYDDKAAAAYRKVVLEHSAAPHVEDAKDRLAAMNLPIPTPTPEEAAASAALEGSRGQYNLKERATLLFFHKPDVVAAAREGAPSLTDPKPTYAPQITKQIVADFSSALNPAAAAAAPAANQPATSDEAGSTAAPVPAPAAGPAAPLTLHDVPSAGADTDGDSTVMTGVPGDTGAAPASTRSGAGTSMGVEIVSPGSSSPADDNGGLKAVGGESTAPLPPVEKAAPAPDAINDIQPGTQPAAEAPKPGGKKANPAFDKQDESSSKHKKKKGLKKLNPL